MEAKNAPGQLPPRMSDIELRLRSIETRLAHGDAALYFTRSFALTAELEPDDGTATASVSQTLSTAELAAIEMAIAEGFH